MKTGGRLSNVHKELSRDFVSTCGRGDKNSKFGASLNNTEGAREENRLRCHVRHATKSSKFIAQLCCSTKLLRRLSVFHLETIAKLA